MENLAEEQIATQAAKHASEIKSLQRELEERPIQVVTKVVGEEVLTEARSEADRAFRSRESAYQALSEIWLIHRDRGDGKCWCVAAGKCKTLQIIERNPAFINWESEQSTAASQALRTRSTGRAPGDPRPQLDSWSA